MKNICLGVQSYCFREFKDNNVVAGMVREIGLSAIELCGVQVDFKNPEQFGAAITAYKGQGVSIVSTGVNGISGNEGDDRKLFDFLKLCGAKYMSVNFRLETLDAALASAEKLADEFDVKLGIHIHGGRHWLSNAEALKWLFKRTSPRIGLNIDTAWALDAGEDPVELIRRFSDRLYLVHLKDFLYDSARNFRDVVVGTGNINLAEVKKALEETGFSGEAIIEYEADPANPIPALKECVAAITRVIPFKV